ncbi:MAG: ROK family protein, partial [Planctomycetes bacterium]|nr:ROK family protein [Planctomycetota bacterium]
MVRNIADSLTSIIAILLGMILGIDLGGTKVAFALFSVGDDATCTQCWPDGQPMRRATPPSYAATLALIVEETKALRAQFPALRALGIGVPGAISTQTRRIKNANSTWLIGEDLAGDLRAALGLAVAVANDANSFALAEASPQGVSFGVILGTGVGGGLVVDGKAIEGRNGVAGEWGHLTLADDARVEGLPPNPMLSCYCGNRGCIETLLSGPGLMLDFLSSRWGDHEFLGQVSALLLEGDEDALGAKGLEARLKAGAFDAEQAVLAQELLASEGEYAALAFLRQSARRVAAMAALIPETHGTEDDKARLSVARLLELAGAEESLRG